MSRRRSRKGSRSLMIGLGLANVVILAIVVWLVLQRSDTAETTVAEAPAPQPVQVTPVASESFSWQDRLAPDAGADPRCPDCNVIAIALDIFRPDHLECMGYPHETAPNICKMFEEGVLFDTFVAHAYQTPIAQMANFTGRYPSKSGFVTFNSRLAADVPTLPERLQQAGYHTVAMGSSFEVMSDMSTAMADHTAFKADDLNPGLSFGRGFDRFIFTGHRNIPTDAIPWLKQHGDEPFFLWTIFGTLHWPYGSNVPPEHHERFDPKPYDGILRPHLPLSFQLLSRIYNGRIYRESMGPAGLPLGPDDHGLINARYDLGLWWVDRFIGELMQSLPPERLQKTIIILYGVHGEDLGEHGYYGHYDIFDVETRMSMVILSPMQRLEQSRRVSTVTEGVDFAPTVLDLLGLDPLPDIDGQSLVPAMQSGEGDPERTAFIERVPLWEDIFRYKNSMPKHYVARVSRILDAEVVADRAIRSQDWKLIHRTAREVEEEVSWYAFLETTPLERDEWELYDLKADPTEQHNVYADHPEEAAPLRETLLAWEATLPPLQR